MKRLLLDTNIYGEMIVDDHLNLIKEKLKQRGESFVIFGISLIRRELRATPRKIKAGGGNLRIYLLSLYDELVKQKNLEVTLETLALAEQYYLLYRELGGSKGKDEMTNDLLIVACAALKEMDIVVSEDESTLKSEHALQAYGFVNVIRKLRNPHLISYQEFKHLLR